MAEDAETDAWGRTGEESKCWACDGRGTEWGEACLTCGGTGWVREEAEIQRRRKEGE